MRLDHALWYSDARLARAARTALVPLSAIYARVMRSRAAAYASGRRPRVTSDVPVVSVGNLTVGGSGKTPVVLWIVEELLRRGLRPVVVSRGYGVAVDKPVVLLPTNTRRADAAERAGDEPVLIARRTGVPVVVTPDRARGCELADRELGADLVVLDDGFQHQGLARDLDIVVLTGEEQAARVLPAGPLREPFTAVTRADVVLGPDGALPEGALPEAADLPFHRFERRAIALVATPDGDARKRGLDELKGARVVAVSGIARPQGFAFMLQEAGATVISELSFGDHHEYSEADWQKIAAAAEDAASIVTTEKDLVKLARFAPDHAKLCALRIVASVDRGDELMERIAALVRRV